MRALVTGCAGFIGSHLTEALLEKDFSVVGIDCFNDNYGRDQKLSNLRTFNSQPHFEFVPVDLSRGDLGAFVGSADIIFHLAAEPGVRSSWGSRYLNYVNNNVIATQLLLEAVSHHSSARFVYASSSSVYGDPASLPTTEESPLTPLSPYGQTKLSGEHLCHLYRLERQVDTVTLRYFTVFGPRQRPDMAFHRFCAAAIQGKPITVFDDGFQTRDFTYVTDVVAATISAGAVPLGESRVFNIGGGAPTNLRNVLGILEEMSGSSLDVRYTPREAGDVRNTSADTSLARDQLMFSPATGLADGLASEYEWVAGLPG